MKRLKKLDLIDYNEITHNQMKLLIGGSGTYTCKMYHLKCQGTCPENETCKEYKDGFGNTHCGCRKD